MHLAAWGDDSAATWGAWGIVAHVLMGMCAGHDKSADFLQAMHHAAAQTAQSRPGSDPSESCYTFLPTATDVHTQSSGMFVLACHSASLLDSPVNHSNGQSSDPAVYPADLLLSVSVLQRDRGSFCIFCTGHEMLSRGCCRRV